jgi:hypothetical protein
MLVPIKFFMPISIPRILDSDVQQCAIEHLNVRDIGQLRDKYEGQRYYEKLRMDIFSEYAFEKALEFGDFDWDYRKNKYYSRCTYDFNNNKVNLIHFTSDSLPLVDFNIIQNAVFVYIKPDYKVYLSGVATKKILIENTRSSSIYNPFNKNLKEVSNFKNFLPFKNKEELIRAVEGG